MLQVKVRAVKLKIGPGEDGPKLRRLRCGTFNFTLQPGPVISQVRQQASVGVEIYRRASESAFRVIEDGIVKVQQDNLIIDDYSPM